MANAPARTPKGRQPVRSSRTPRGGGSNRPVSYPGLNNSNAEARTQQHTNINLIPQVDYDENEYEEVFRSRPRVIDDRRQFPSSIPSPDADPFLTPPPARHWQEDAHMRSMTDGPRPMRSMDSLRYNAGGPSRLAGQRSERSRWTDMSFDDCIDGGGIGSYTDKHEIRSRGGTSLRLGSAEARYQQSLSPTGLPADVEIFRQNVSRVDIESYRLTPDQMRNLLEESMARSRSLSSPMQPYPAAGFPINASRQPSYGPSGPEVYMNRARQDAGRGQNAYRHQPPDMRTRLDESLARSGSASPESLQQRDVRSTAPSPRRSDPSGSARTSGTLRQDASRSEGSTSPSSREQLRRMLLEEKATLEKRRQQTTPDPSSPHDSLPTENANVYAQDQFHLNHIHPTNPPPNPNPSTSPNLPKSAWEEYQSYGARRQEFDSYLDEVMRATSVTPTEGVSSRVTLSPTRSESRTGVLESGGGREEGVRGGGAAVGAEGGREGGFVGLEGSEVEGRRVEKLSPLPTDDETMAIEELDAPTMSPGRSRPTSEELFIDNDQDFDAQETRRAASASGVVHVEAFMEKMGRLQKQVKEMRRYFKAILRLEEERYTPSIVRIQAVFRGYLVRRDLSNKGIHIRRRRGKSRSDGWEAVERWCRVPGRGGLGDGDTKESKSATKIQALVRGHLTRKAVHDFQLHHWAAVRIQSIWRGHHTRQTLGPTFRLKILEALHRRHAEHMRGVTVEMEVLRAKVDRAQKEGGRMEYLVKKLYAEVEVLRAWKVDG
ncbi:hypothetical protein HDV00_000231 [Rhizophlyctis rosea]|nr:hypothetical protein HDV00_000231 [Rhizophlyctis rosea]